MIFKTSSFTRTTLLKLLNNLTPEQLCFIPKGFNNHILWNIGHILVTEQLLSYKLSDLEMHIDKEFVALYGKGSVPKKNISSKDVDAVISQLIPVIKKAKEDYKNGVFKTFYEYKTSIGITLNNIDDAIQFNSFHEGIHLGIILSIKKLLK